MLNRAGREITRAKRSFRMPFAALISRRTLPILKTLTTLSKVGVMKILLSTSSSTTPKTHRDIRDTLYTQHTENRHEIKTCLA